MLPPNDFGLIFSLLLLPLSKAHAGAAILVDELDAGSFPGQSLLRSVSSPALRALWLETHPLPTISDQRRIEGKTSVVGNSSE